MAHEFTEIRKRKLVERLDRLDSAPPENLASTKFTGEPAPTRRKRVPVKAIRLGIILACVYIGYSVIVNQPPVENIIAPTSTVQSEPMLGSKSATLKQLFQGSEQINWVKAGLTDSSNSEISYQVTVGTPRGPSPVNVDGYAVNSVTSEEIPLSSTSCQIAEFDNFKQYDCSAAIHDRVETGSYHLKIEARSYDDNRFTTTGLFHITR